MKFREVYESVIGLWPESIVIDDNGTPEPDADGHVFPSLSSAWDDVERRVGFSDPWRELMVWTIFQHLHHEAMERSRNGEAALTPGDLDSAAVEERYFQNMNRDQWRHLLADYERDVEPPPDT